MAAPEIIAKTEPISPPKQLMMIALSGYAPSAKFPSEGVRNAQIQSTKAIFTADAGPGGNVDVDTEYSHKPANPRSNDTADQVSIPIALDGAWLSGPIAFSHSCQIPPRIAPFVMPPTMDRTTPA